MFAQVIMAGVLSALLVFSEPQQRPPADRRTNSRRLGGAVDALHRPAAITVVVAPGYPLERRFLYVRVGDHVYPLLIEFDDSV